MLYMLKIIETNRIYNDPFKVDVLLDITDTSLNTDEKIRNALQNAYNEFYNSLGYKSQQEADKDGVCFGSMFKSMPSRIMQKYGFLIVEPSEIYADYDKGFSEPNEIIKTLYKDYMI